MNSHGNRNVSRQPESIPPIPSFRRADWASLISYCVGGSFSDSVLVSVMLSGFFRRAFGW